MSKDIDLIDYKGYFHDMRRITPSVEDLQVAPEPEKFGRDIETARRFCNQQIRLRKRIMAGLDTEIQEYRKLLGELE